MSTRYETPKGALFTPFKSRKEAEKAVRQTTTVQLIFFVIQFLGSLVVQPLLAMLPVLLVGMTFWLRFQRSRPAAIVLIVACSLDLLARVLALQVLGLVPMAFFVGSAVMLWLACNAERATRFLASAPPELPPGAASR